MSETLVTATSATIGLVLAWALGAGAWGCTGCGGGDGARVDDAGSDSAAPDDTMPLDSGGEDVDGDADEPDAPSPPLADWVGVLGTGQSLSVGAAGWPVVSTVQPYKNLKLTDVGPDPKYPLDGGGTLSLIPLVEPIRANGGKTGGQYPDNIYGETPHSGMANEISALFFARTSLRYVTVHSVVGWSGHPLSDLNKAGTGVAYPASLSEARSIKKLADKANKTFAYGAIILTHGESDANNAAYAAGVHQLWTDYDTDLKAITGQATTIPLLISQQSTIGNGSTISPSTLAAWKLGVDYPGKIVCSGPKYQYQYATDNLHFDAAGYRRLGVKYGEVMDAVVNRGIPWKPLQPKSAVRSGKKITVTFDVPNPSLAWDEHISKPHQTEHAAWAMGRGFEVADSTGEVTIKGVAIVGNTVEIALASAPSGSGLVVRYAVTQDGSGLQGGTDSGRRGQLRDSDDLVGYDIETLSVKATSGSATVTSVAPGAFAKRTGHDIVTGAGAPADWVVMKKVSADQLMLSAPWLGATGNTTLTMSYDQHNYCVHFEMPVSG